MAVRLPSMYVFLTSHSSFVCLLHALPIPISADLPPIPPFHYTDPPYSLPGGTSVYRFHFQDRELLLLRRGIWYV